MQNEKIHIERIKRLLERKMQDIHPNKTEMPVSYIYSMNQIPFQEIQKHEFQPIKIGEKWGEVWGSAWFKVAIEVPIDYAGKTLGLHFDCDGEACVFVNGSPWQGLTPKVDWYHNAAKYYVPITDCSTGEERQEILIEAAANDLFGAGKEDYCLRNCSLVSYDQNLHKLLMDIGFLLNLAENLPKGNVRRQKIIFGLNKVCDLWNSDQEAVVDILKDLLSKTANASALTAYSVGHAHLDLAWLWPIRETKRKGGRSFANALRMIDKYPEYVFGASQAQLYQWIKDIYPGLYSAVKDAYSTGKWDIQGASWVEFDTNLISGESIIRQFYYGSKFFQDEFQFEPKILWLPDCFGFNGNLPQLMKGCGVDYFVTQKLSWNETNMFPYHLFVWQGIDGTEVLAHQLPTNDYNFSNNPSSFLQTEERFTQSEFADAYLNLYGIGDGGGGPTQNHIEYGLRMRDLEGLPKFKFCKSTEYFEYLETLERGILPKMYGELYLEFHRGTYTSQALMKRNNRKSEMMLSVAEAISALNERDYPEILNSIWKDTLLLQFHDIIPGSSIKLVYDDAQKICRKNHDFLKTYIDKEILGESSSSNTTDNCYLFFNASQWDRSEWVLINDLADNYKGFDARGNEIATVKAESGLYVLINCPSYGFQKIRLVNQPYSISDSEIPYVLENEHICVSVTKMGTISSIKLKEADIEVLAGESNDILLWEDEPNNWGAWDINHFYRTTVPTKATSVTILESECINIAGVFQRIVHRIEIGNSILKQYIELGSGDKHITIKHNVNWNENHKMLRTRFLTSVQSDNATYEIASAVIKRSNKPKNTWESVQFEVPAHRFADLSQTDFGVALLNDSKYGYRIQENEMELNLLRSPADVDPTADIHSHSYQYAIYPHTKSYENSDVLPIAHQFNMPLYLVKCEFETQIPTPFGINIDSTRIKIDVVKPAYDTKAIALRLYEFTGSCVDAKLHVPSQYGYIYRSDMKEKSMQLFGNTNPILLSFKPFEIITLVLCGAQL